VNGTSYDVLMASNGIQPGTGFSAWNCRPITRLLSFHTEQLPDSVGGNGRRGELHDRGRKRPTRWPWPGTSTASCRGLQPAESTAGQHPGAAGCAIRLRLREHEPGPCMPATAPARSTACSSTRTCCRIAWRRCARATSPGADRGRPERRADTSGLCGQGLCPTCSRRATERALSSGLWLRGFSQKGDQSATRA